MALHPQTPAPARLAWTALVLVLLLPIGWGIHPSYCWDVDNIAPGSVLKAMAAGFGPGWHSSDGPLPYLVTAFVWAPILVVMRLAGELGRPSGTYPWGFAHPEAAIATLVVAARLVSLLLALGVAWLAARDLARARLDRRAPPAPGWLVPVLLAGSATFVYYARTSNVDMAALFWTWLAFALVETRHGSTGRYAAAAVAAVAAVCCKEQTAPFAAVVGLAACVRAWRRPRRPRRLAGAALVAAAGLAAYTLIWCLPFNASGWLAHHEFLWGVTRAERPFPATLAGLAGLGSRALELAPITLGLPVVLGLLVALVARPALRGLGLRAWASVLYLAGFIGPVGYVYPRFLLLLMPLLVPVAGRGLHAALARAGAAPRAALAGAILALALAGGPALDLLMLRDTRYAVEHWLAREVPAGSVVEVAGNPRFQARVPRALTLLASPPDSLRARPRGPVGDVVLLSSLDAYAFRREPLRGGYADSLGPAGGYRLAHVERPGALARLVPRLPVAPLVEVYVRER